MTGRGVKMALAVAGVFGMSLGFVTTVAYQLGERRAKVQNFYYPVPTPNPIATDVAPLRKSRVRM